jgi:hypothetical protein
MPDNSRMTIKTGEPSTKKVYEPPKLTRYGTVAKITKTLGIHGNYDNFLHIARTTLR